MRYNLQKIEDAEFYVRTALRKAERKTSQIKARTFKDKKKNRLLRLDIAGDSIKKYIENIIRPLEDIEAADEFYSFLINIEIGNERLKNDIRRLKWSRHRIKVFFMHYKRLIARCEDINCISANEKMLLGRVKSVLKRCRLSEMDNYRRIIKKFPDIKNKYTICITGFPNVGKSTLLKKLTGANVEIQSYAFTTKSLMVGYMEEIQVIDTPGTLDRIDKMNDIEKYSYAALKFLANMVIYVFDITGTCGYSVEKQMKLFEMIKKNYKKVVVYLSKTDLMQENKIKSFRNSLLPSISFGDAFELRKYILEYIPPTPSLPME